MRINGTYHYYATQATAVQSEKPSQINMQALVTHELGHVLGLKHKDTENSVMATFLSNNTDRVAIPDTDKTALQCEY